MSNKFGSMALRFTSKMKKSFGRAPGGLGELYVHPNVLEKRRKAAKAASKARKKNK